MIWIEFLGGVGSGKSSLEAALKAHLQADGFAVYSPQEAVAARLSRALPRAVQNGTVKRAARKILLAGWQTAFSLNHSALIRQVIQANRALKTLPSWHRKIIRGLFFEVAGWYQGLSGGFHPDGVVLVEEGLAHRAVNLYAWKPGPIDEEVVRAYLESLPAVSLTVVVHAPESDCLQRASSRGLPARLRGKDAAEVQRFIHNSHGIASFAGAALASLGRPVIEIDNSASLEQAASTLYNRLAEHGLFRSTMIARIQMAEELTQ